MVVGQKIERHKIEWTKGRKWTKGRMDKRSKVKKDLKVLFKLSRDHIQIGKMCLCFIRIKYASSIACFNLFKQQNVHFC